MTLPDSINCTHASAASTDIWVNFYVSLNGILCLIPPILLWKFVHNKQMCRVFALLNQNSKVLFYSFAFLLLMHTCVVSVLTLTNLLNALPLEDPCQHQWTTFGCLCLKIPIYFCVFGFSSAHVGMFLERFIATQFVRQYHKIGKQPGITLMIGSHFLTIIILFFIYKEEDLTKTKAYCVSTTSYSSSRFDRALYSLTVLDLLALIGDLFVWLKNRMQMRRVNDEYSLNKAFQLRENLLNIRLLVPLSSVHTLFYVGYLFSSAFNRYRAKLLDPTHHVMVIVQDQVAIAIYSIVIVLAAMTLFRLLDQQFKINNRLYEANSHFKHLNMLFESRIRDEHKSSFLFMK